MRRLGPDRRFLAAIVPLGLAAIPTLTAACTSTANISDVYLALDSDGARRRSVFFTDTKEIHCIAEGGFGRKDVTVEGYIRVVRVYDPKEDDFDTVDRYSEFKEFTPTPSTGGGPTKVDIVMKPINAKGEDDSTAPLPAGSYKCEYLLDGKLEKSVDFNIDFPDCPGQAIVAGDPCLGFYKIRTPCPGGGAKSTDNDKCTCQAQGWECR